MPIHKIRVFGLATALSVMSGCQREYEVLYQDVDASEPWQDKDMVLRKYPSPNAAPQYIIVGKKMYLNVQIVRQIFIYTAVGHMSWDSARISKLARNDVNFSSHLPNPADHYGGIKWLQKPQLRPAN